jgi:hypothetical protein
VFSRAANAPIGGSGFLDRDSVMTPPHFPPPWSVKETAACFIVKDNAGQKLACVYFEDEAGRRSVAKLLTRDEARRIAAKIAALAELIRN